MEGAETKLSPDTRAAHIPAGYSPWKHMARTLVLAGGIGAFSLWLARNGTIWDWLLMPAFFVVANFVEWAFHRGPMHRLVGPRVFYNNHALVHHRAFHHDSMPVGSARELELVMMPWFTMLLLFVLASPVAIAAWWLRGPAAAGVFYLTAALYFLTYETLHALYHVPPEALKRVGLGTKWLQALSAHHTHHHRLDRMAHVNFNVTFPIMDWVMGTKETEAQAPVSARHKVASSTDAA